METESTNWDLDSSLTPPVDGSESAPMLPICPEQSAVIGEAAVMPLLPISDSRRLLQRTDPLKAMPQIGPLPPSLQGDLQRTTDIRRSPGGALPTIWPTR